jgi:hypothetical protein
MRIRVHSDVARFTAGMDDAANRQIPFALARALTLTAKDAQDDVRAGLAAKFTLRNTWVSRGIRITPATKANPVAIVGSLEPFMAKQETGGDKKARGGHRLTPPKVKSTSVTPKSRRATAVRNKPRVFVNMTKTGPAILYRVTEERDSVIVLYWLNRGVKVKPRFGFKGTTEKTIRDRFGANFVASLSDAMGHRG